MVAEAVEKPLAGPKRKMGTGKNQRIPLFTRIKARNLYVSQGLGGPEVAKSTGLHPNQIYQLAHREGWTKLRRELSQRVEKDSNARALADIDAIVEEVANDTAELALGTLAKSKVTLERTDENAARDLQSYSQAAKNFVGLYRQAKSIDVAAQQGNTVNVLYVACPRVGIEDSKSVPAIAPAKAEPINVTPTQVTSDAAK